MFGANRHPYQEPGEWQVSLASRNLVSNDHYNGTVEQVQRQTLQNYVTNRQNLVDLAVSTAVNRRLALTFAMPFVNSSWASRDPAYPLPAARHEIAQNGRGIGDISLTGRYWLFDTQTHDTWNIAAGRDDLSRQCCASGRYSQDREVGDGCNRRSKGSKGERRTGPTGAAAVGCLSGEIVMRVERKAAHGGAERAALRSQVNALRPARGVRSTVRRPVKDRYPGQIRGGRDNAPAQSRRGGLDS